jgi:hypothetical protein
MNENKKERKEEVSNHGTKLEQPRTSEKRPKGPAEKCP